jgi:hypothetical protein
MLELRGFGIEINGINEQVVEMKRNVLRALRQTRKEARGNGVVAVKGGVKRKPIQPRAMAISQEIANSTSLTGSR